MILKGQKPKKNSGLNISIEDIKKLREMTSVGVIECKKALEKAQGDFDKAKEILKKRGLEIAAKKAGRDVKDGRIEAYIHPGSKVGVLVEINCETDFVARSADYCVFTKDTALHIAAMNPKYIKREDVPADVLKQQRDPEVFIKETCLLEQPFLKDQSQTIKDCLNALIAKVGENVIISRFCRYKVNEVD